MKLIWWATGSPGWAASGKTGYPTTLDEPTNYMDVEHIDWLNATTEL